MEWWVVTKGSGGNVPTIPLVSLSILCVLSRQYTDVVLFTGIENGKFDPKTTGKYVRCLKPSMSNVGGQEFARMDDIGNDQVKDSGLIR